MSRIMLPLLAAAALAAAPAQSAPSRAAEPPSEPMQLRPGPHVEAAQTFCRVCHSLDYITTQPPAMGAGFWQAEVTKMVKTFGAPIPDEQAGQIVEYLNAAYRRGAN